MKTLNIPLDDKDYEKLSDFKDGLSWRDFIILMYTHCLDSKKKGDFDVYKDKRIIREVKNGS